MLSHQALSDYYIVINISFIYRTQRNETRIRLSWLDVVDVQVH